MLAQPVRTLLAALVARPRYIAPFACAAAPSILLRPVLTTWLDNTIANEQKKRASLQKEAEAARKAERLSQWATLVVSNLYRIKDDTKSVVVEDWDNGGQETELTFDTTKGTPKQQADDAFKKARKMRRGSAVVAALIEQSEATEGKLDAWRARVEAMEEDTALSGLRAEILKEGKKLKLKLTGLEEVTDSASLPRGKRAELQQPALYASQTPGWPGREFQSPNGVPILVGRNRAQNEQLSLSICRDPDVWMHVRGSPGAHVVLQMSRIKGHPEPDDDCLQMAADLAAFYSEARDEKKALVTYARPKHVTKPKGAPLGAVKLREEGGTIVGRPTNSEFIPSEVRDLREGGGFGAGGTVKMSGGGGKKFT